MKRMGEMLERHRNAFLILLLAASFLIGATNPEPEAASVVDVPVLAASQETLSPLEAFRRQRDSDALRDIAALEALISQEVLDEDTRQSAAEHLQSLVSARQGQTAIEGALVNSSLSPCAVVISEGAATIVTQKVTITEADMVMVMELCALHAGIDPARVQIITAGAS